MKKRAFVEQMARIAWQEFPGHFGGALSKALVGPENAGSKLMDFRISRYAPNAYVQEHAHKIQEQVCYVLEGEGLLTLNDEKHLMRPHDYVYVPPGVRHSLTNTGLAGLVFLVVTTPADDEASFILSDGTPPLGMPSSKGVMTSTNFGNTRYQILS